MNYFVGQFIAKCHHPGAQEISTLKTISVNYLHWEEITVGKIYLKNLEKQISYL